MGDIRTGSYNTLLCTKKAANYGCLMSIESKPLFISHAVADRQLASALVEFLEEGIGVPENEIFCSSLKGKGIPAGKRFVEYIKEQISGPKIVILLLTKNYYESDFCLSELGAAWVKSHDIYPILVPPLTYDDVKDVLLGTQVTKISDSIQLNELRETLADKLGFELKSGFKWDAKRDLFLDKVSEIVPKLPKPQKVDRSEYEKLEVKNKEYLEGLKEYEKEVTNLKAVIEKIKKSKDKSEVSAILLAEAGEQEVYDKLLADTQADLNDLPTIAVYMLFKYFSGEAQVVFNAFEEKEKINDASQAVDDGYLVHNGESFQLNQDDPSISEAIEQLNKTNEFLESEISEDFFEELKKKLGLLPEITNRRFWKKEIYGSYLY